MRCERTLSPDGATLAQSVRAVALRAQRILKGPVDPEESLELLEEIRSLEEVVDSRTSEDLSRWLASLRRQIESHGVLVG